MILKYPVLEKQILNSAANLGHRKWISPKIFKDCTEIYSLQSDRSCVIVVTSVTKQNMHKSCVYVQARYTSTIMWRIICFVY